MMQATGSGQRHAGLTRLRFFLIGWVILYHLNLPLHVTDTWTWLGPVLWRGYLGVDGFFLLSGFALWLGYGTRPPRGCRGDVAFPAAQGGEDLAAACCGAAHAGAAGRACHGAWRDDPSSGAV
ncbi:hypothetical protein [Dankookia sp. P2]|uniref:hypothetical protein n=1 Tax=Dankookia sp. P2 TaxID=3423955 RepID=UPI003D67699C